MIKTDTHMLKLKDHLLAEKRRKDERVKSVKERQMKKFAKKVRPLRFHISPIPRWSSIDAYMMMFKTMGISLKTILVENSFSDKHQFELKPRLYRPSFCLNL